MMEIEYGEQKWWSFPQNVHPEKYRPYKTNWEQKPVSCETNQTPSNLIQTSQSSEHGKLTIAYLVEALSMQILRGRVLRLKDIFWLKLIYDNSNQTTG